MNPFPASALRSALLSTTLFALAAFAPVIVTAGEPELADPFADTLTTGGVIPLTKATTWTRDSFNGHIAGPEVVVGIPQALVGRLLGNPTATLADDTLLYRDFSAEGSSAGGVLVVRFAHHRVSQILLVSPAVATALLTTRNAGPRPTQIASK